MDLGDNFSGKCPPTVRKALKSSLKLMWNFQPRTTRVSRGNINKANKNCDELARCLSVSHHSTSSTILNLTPHLKSMVDFASISPRKWMEKVVKFFISTTSLVVFTFLDLLDFILCYFYKFFDTFVEEESAARCYCQKKHNWGKQGTLDVSAGGENDGGQEEQISETLTQRKNFFRDLGIWKCGRTKNCGNHSYSINQGGGFKALKSKWSDCGCDSYLSWQLSGDHKLHVVAMETPSKGIDQDNSEKQVENVLLLHGFLSSSSFWVESIFPNISGTENQNYKLFAVDLLGFGKSPKPWECLYTLNDHVEMVEKSVINPLNLKSFHIVAHSMGCIVAMGLASKHLSSVKSITVVAPPYCPSSNDALDKLAGRRLWPPILFASSVMSWYEHLGRCVCLIYCRNHQTWERILKLLLRKRDLHFTIVDSTRHTHHSAWHTMHNVICGGAKLMDEYLDGVNKSGIMVTIIQGEKDHVTPLECIHSLKLKVPLAEVRIISNADHNSVVFGRKKEFTKDLEQIWLSASRSTSFQGVGI